MRKLLLSLIIIIGFTSFKVPEHTWLALGDSITYLNDHANETGNRVTKGYLTRVTEHMKDLRYINQGHNGWTAVRIAKEIENLKLENADVYSVFLGTNDWWSGQPLGTISDYNNNTGNGTFFGAYRTIINKLRSLNEKASIVLITPMQRVDFIYLNDFKNNAWGSYKEKNGQSLEQFANAIKAIAQQEHFGLVDLYHSKELPLKKLVKYKRLKDPATGSYRNYAYPSFIDVPFNPAADEYPYPAASIDLTYDGLHPSDKGNEIIARLLVKEMKKKQR